MTLGRKYKKKPQRTIITRSFKPNTDLLNKLTNSSELPHSTGMQSNMAVNSSSASNNHFHEISSGYGTADKKLHFNGVKDEFKSWQTRMKLRLRKMELASILDEDEPATDKNLQVYMEIVEHIDDKSLKLIEDVAEDNGKLAWKILSETYLGNDEDRIFRVLFDLGNLTLKRDETVVDYLCRIDGIKKVLESNKIPMPDSMYVIMGMKGLPQEYDILCDVIHTQKTKPTFEDFKSQLKAKEIRMCDTNRSSVAKVMFVGDNSAKTSSGGNKPRDGRQRCKKCLSVWHSEDKCKSTSYCNFCENASHDSKFCYHPKNPANACKKEYVKAVNHIQEEAVCVSGGDAGRYPEAVPGAPVCVAEDVGRAIPRAATDVNMENIKVAPAEYYDLLRTKEACPGAYTDIVGAVGSGAIIKASNCTWDGALFKPPNIWHVRHINQGTNKYLVDSGATHHIITDKSKFVSLDCDYDPQKHNLMLANGTTEYGKIKGKGLAYIVANDESGNPQCIRLCDALYVPSFTQNILSVMSLVNNGMQLFMKKNEVKLQDGNITYLADCEAGLAYLQVDH